MPFDQANLLLETYTREAGENEHRRDPAAWMSLHPFCCPTTGARRANGSVDNEPQRTPPRPKGWQPEAGWKWPTRCDLVSEIQVKIHQLLFHPCIQEAFTGHHYDINHNQQSPFLPSWSPEQRGPTRVTQMFCGGQETGASLHRCRGQETPTGV